VIRSGGDKIHSYNEYTLDDMYPPVVTLDGAAYGRRALVIAQNSDQGSHALVLIFPKNAPEDWKSINDIFTKDDVFCPSMDFRIYAIIYTLVR